MSESVERRRRRKFVAGVIDQIGTGVRGGAVGVFTAGGVAPIIAGTAGGLAVAPMLLLGTVFVATLLACLLLAFAARLKGIAKRLEDDGSNLISDPKTVDRAEHEGSAP